MKKFKFSLQVLLDVRCKEEKSLKGKLHEARANLSKNEELLNVLMQKSEECQNIFKKSSQTSIKVNQIHDYYNHLERLRVDIEAQKKILLTAENECEMLLQELIEIKRTIKMLETLKESKYQDYLKEVELEDIKLMDDFINSKALNK